MPAVARAAQRSLTATRVAQRSLNWKRRNSQELTDASMRRLSDALSIDLAEHLRLTAEKLERPDADADAAAAAAAEEEDEAAREQRRRQMSLSNIVLPDSDSDDDEPDPGWSAQDVAFLERFIADWLARTERAHRDVTKDSFTCWRARSSTRSARGCAGSTRSALSLIHI